MTDDCWLQLFNCEIFRLVLAQMLNFDSFDSSSGKSNTFFQTQIVLEYLDLFGK